MAVYLPFVVALSLFIAVGRATPIKPDGIIEDWTLKDCSEAKLKEIYQAAKAEIEKLGNDIANATTISVDTILMVRLYIESKYGSRGTVTNYFDIVGDVHIDKNLRQLGADYKQKVQDDMTELEKRLTVHQKLVDLESLVTQGKIKLEGELLKCLTKLISIGKRNGMSKPQEIQDKIAAEKKTISDLTKKINKNISEDESYFTSEIKYLRGVDEKIPGYTTKYTIKGTTLVKIPLKYEFIAPIYRHCTNPDTRKLLDWKFNSLPAAANEKLLNELFLAYDRLAKLLDFDTYADFTLDNFMAKKPQIVETFLKSLIDPIKKRYLETELLELLELKKEECKKFNIEYTNKLDSWDYRHFYNLLNVKKFKMDMEEVKEYFKYENVVDGMIKLFSNLLKLKFTKVENAQVWEPSVTAYKVEDASGKNEGLLGYLYLDLIYREGKSSTFCSPMQRRCNRDKAGNKVPTAFVLISNIKMEPEGEPTLLRLTHVETMFQMFGLAMHNLSSTKAETPLFEGTLVEGDFAPTTGMMFKNWCINREVLNEYAKHHKTGAQMPKDMIDGILKVKNNDNGSQLLWDLSFALADIRIHSTIISDQAKFDPVKIYYGAQEEVLEMTRNADSNALLTSSHLGGGSNSRYYKFQWGNAYADELLSVFEQKGLLNSDVGLEFREKVLGPGGTISGNDLVKSFIGREPDTQAYVRRVTA